MKRKANTKKNICHHLIPALKILSIIDQVVSLSISITLVQEIQTNLTHCIVSIGMLIKLGLHRKSMRFFSRLLNVHFCSCFGRDFLSVKVLTFDKITWDKVLFVVSVVRPPLEFHAF